MGKRSDFLRIPKDRYLTFDQRAYPALAQHVVLGTTFYEPCVGRGHMVTNLERMGLHCTGGSDIGPEIPYLGKHAPSRQIDALKLTKDDLRGAHRIITNPVWSRVLLHPMIEHLSSLAPPWLLFDAGWAFTGQAAPYLKYCRKIVTVGRLTWIPGTTVSSLDDCAWYFFDRTGPEGTRFFGK